jgi:hypothetical protein
MLSCTRFVERLYDEDCRRALETGAPAPPDVADHITLCTECRRAWEEAAGDVRTLPGLLTQPAPVALERRLRLRLAAPLGTVAREGWAQEAAWWIAVGAAAALAAARTLPADLAGVDPLVLALVGASLAFVAGAVRDALRRLVVL